MVRIEDFGLEPRWAMLLKKLKNRTGHSTPVTSSIHDNCCPFSQRTDYWTVPIDTNDIDEVLDIFHKHTHHHLTRCIALQVRCFAFRWSALKSFLVARKIPFDDPVVLDYVRLGLISSWAYHEFRNTVRVVLLGKYYYVSMTLCLPGFISSYDLSPNQMIRLFSNMASQLLLSSVISSLTFLQLNR